MRYVSTSIQVQGGVTPIDSIVTAATARSKLSPALFGVLTIDHADFRALIIDCIEFQLLTVDYIHIYIEVYGRMLSDATPSLVHWLTSTVADVTSESMGVTPP